MERYKRVVSTTRILSGALLIATMILTGATHAGESHGTERSPDTAIQPTRFADNSTVPPPVFSRDRSTRNRPLLRVAQRRPSSDVTTLPVPGRASLPPSGPPELRMTELTIDTSVKNQVGGADGLDTPIEMTPYVLGFDTDHINPDLRFSYANRALGYRHHPLYFEDVALERYGVSCGVWDPFFAAAHFAGNVVILPYKMAVNHPYHSVATYGARQDFWANACYDSSRLPGDPVLRSHLGVAVETLVVTALVLGL